MSDLSRALETAMALEGAIGVAVVDVRSGDILLQKGGGACLSLGLATAVNSKMVRANQEITSETESISKMEDILVTFDAQYHLIRPIANSRGVEGLFLFLALDRTKGNLAMARRKLGEIEGDLVLTPGEVEALTSVREIPVPPIRAEPIADRYRTVTDITSSVGTKQTDITSSVGAKQQEIVEELPPFLRDESVLKLLGFR